MAFGDRLFQLAQGIIQNERQRKQLEIEREQVERQTKQFEKTFGLRVKEVEAQSRINKLREEQLELQAQEQRSPQAQEMARLALELQRARVATERAKAAAAGAPGSEPASVSDRLKLGQARASVIKRVQTQKTNSVVEAILDDNQAALGALVPPDTLASLNTDVIAEGLGLGSSGPDAPPPWRTLEDLDAAIGSEQRLLQAAETARLPPEAKQTRLAQIEARIRKMQGARAELQKVFQTEPSFAEFQEASQFDRPLTNQIWRDGVPLGTMKLEIWGSALSDSAAGPLLDEAMRSLRDTGQPNAMERFVRMHPGNLLDESGRLSVEGAQRLSTLFHSNGIPPEKGLRLIESLSNQ